METIYNNLTTITWLICILIAASPFLLKNKFSKDQVASLVITAGITGTFLGVTLGLLQFDSNNIEESVPTLITGLRTAFFTSLAGLFTNLIIRINPRIYGFIIEDDIEDEDLGKELVLAIKQMSNSISGDGDSSLATLLVKLKDKNEDGFQKMNTSFEEFAEKVVADNTQSLIDALTQVMDDFNNQINTQFGENFKRLNDAVGLMVEWQDKYKDHVESLVSQFTNVEQSVRNIDIALRQTAVNSESIVETNQMLGSLIKDFSLQVNSFSEIGEKAKVNYPIIEQSMTQLTKTSNEFISANLSRINENYQSLDRTQNELMDSYQSNIKKMVNSNAERIQKLDDELANELNKALSTLGSQLTSLSQKFVQDYSPLTDKLQKLVQMNKGY